jgi:hypothetical protein
MIYFGVRGFLNKHLNNKYVENYAIFKYLFKEPWTQTYIMFNLISTLLHDPNKILINSLH